MNMSTPSSIALPKGFIPVMLTPFLESGEIDYEGLKLLTELYMRAGSAGLFANCLSSEMYELTEDERLAITKPLLIRPQAVSPLLLPELSACDK